MEPRDFGTTPIFYCTSPHDSGPKVMAENFVAIEPLQWNGEVGNPKTSYFTLQACVRTSPEQSGDPPSVYVENPRRHRVCSHLLLFKIIFEFLIFCFYSFYFEPQRLSRKLMRVEIGKNNKSKLMYVTYGVLTDRKKLTNDTPSVTYLVQWKLGVLLTRSARNRCKMGLPRTSSVSNTSDGFQWVDRWPFRSSITSRLTKIRSETKIKND